MSCDPAGDRGTGGEPDPQPGMPGVPGSAGEDGLRDERLAGFAKGGPWDECLPGPELAAAVAAVAGPGWRCPDADRDELVGVARRLAALEAWAAAGRLGIVRELIRADDLPFLDRPRHGDLPDQWSESVSRELSLALGMSVPAAQEMTELAWDLGARLPGTARLLAEGRLTCAKARLISETFRLLSDADAARAEALLLPRLMAGTTDRTWGQVAALAARVGCEVDPGLAERRRKAAVRAGARVQMWREQSGAAALSGRDLPTGETLAALASLGARAQEYKDSGAFPGARLDQLRATAYLDLLNGVPADARIACGQLTTEDPGPGTGTGPEPGPGPAGPEPGPGPGPNSGGGPGSGSSPRGDDPGDGRDPGGGDRDGPRSSGSPGGDDADPVQPVQPVRPIRPVQPGCGPVLPDLAFPLVTLLGLADRPGEGHGLGVLDPGLVRALAALAAASPYTQACVTVTDAGGTAIGHGCARPGRRAPALPGATVPPSGPAPPLASLPARLNLTITADRLSGMLAGTPGGSGRPPAPGPPDMTGRPAVPGCRQMTCPPVMPGTLGRPAAVGWAFTRSAARAASGGRHTPDTSRLSGGQGAASPPGSPGSQADPHWCGSWVLTLPGGRELTVRLEPVPTLACDHRHETRAYQPGAMLRHLVQVRDHTCTFPTCNRHARDSDFEHAHPYHLGGRTCACNAGARSRGCHRAKQSPGWSLTQPRPGWHEWETPSGRTYTRRPYQYPV